MNLETELVKELSFYNDRGIITIPARQFDVGRIFKFVIVDNHSEIDLTGASVYIRVLMPDGTQFQSTECCRIEDANTVIVDTSVGNGTQLLSVAGINICELHFSYNKGTQENPEFLELTSWEFHILVKERVHDGSSITDKETWDKLDDLLKLYDDNKQIFIELKDIQSILKDIQDELPWMKQDISDNADEIAKLKVTTGTNSQDITDIQNYLARHTIYSNTEPTIQLTDDIWYENY